MKVFLRKVGLWYSNDATHKDLPDIRDFVRPEWEDKERQLVLWFLEELEHQVYKDGGDKVIEDLCLFCSTPFENKSLISDGRYLWPLTLIHYIVSHDVKPPTHFIEHCKKTRRAWISNLKKKKKLDEEKTTSVKSHKYKKCSKCSGSGYVDEESSDGTLQQVECLKCKGKGKLKLKGKKKISQPETVVKIG